MIFIDLTSPDQITDSFCNSVVKQLQRSATVNELARQCEIAADLTEEFIDNRPLDSFTRQNGGL